MVFSERFHPLYWLWLSLRCPHGNPFGRQMLEHFGYDLKRIYEGKEKDYKEVPGYQERFLHGLLDKTSVKERQIFDWCRNNRIQLITPDHPYYPERLWNIAAPPLLLYCRGKLPHMDSCLPIATVGTRTCSDYGVNQSYQISYDLSRCGAIVVSGMAKGIDGTCHQGALDAGGCTVAVLGCGIDRAYPASNALLMECIAANGAILTEFAPGTPPEGRNFPIRNRIISGLSLGTVVFEADISSGALITARIAREQGRDVFALPGKVGEINSTGTNMLLQDGAIPIVCALDILEEYEFLFSKELFIERVRKYIPYSRPKGVVSTPVYCVGAVLPNGEEIPDLREEPVVFIRKDGSFTPDQPEERHNVFGHTKEKKQKPASEPKTAVALPSVEEVFGSDPIFEKKDAQKLYLLLRQSDKTVDELSVESGLPVPKVVATLTFIELSGNIAALPGGRYTVNTVNNG